MRRLLLAALAALASACAPTVHPVAPSETLVPTTAPSVTSPSPAPSASAGQESPRPDSPRLLRVGDNGAMVRQLQERLSDLGYWLGSVDGVFGETTHQAVYALQKSAGLVPDGVVGPKTRAALSRAVVPEARSSDGHVVEIDLARNLLMIVTDGNLDAVLNTSTGGGYTYVSEGTVGVARTPVGLFHVYWQFDGLRISPLGELWRPKFFVGGYAIHGSPSVPPVPVSHGCVRLTNAAIDWIWATDLIPLETPVWIY